MNISKNRYLAMPIFLSFIVMIVISGCSKRKIVINEEYFSVVDKENESIREYEHFMIGKIGDNKDENKGSLEKEIQKYAKIEFDVDSYKDNGTITCKIIAPDVYSYMLTNEKNYLEMESETISTSIIDACKRGELGERKVTIIIPAKKDKGVIVVDTSGEEYKDAVTGGLYSAIGDIYKKSIQEIGES